MNVVQNNQLNRNLVSENSIDEYAIGIDQIKEEH